MLLRAYREVESEPAVDCDSSCEEQLNERAGIRS